MEILGVGNQAHTEVYLTQFWTLVNYWADFGCTDQPDCGKHLQVHRQQKVATNQRKQFKRGEKRGALWVKDITLDL